MVPLAKLAVLAAMLSVSFAALSTAPESAKIPKGEITEYGICERYNVSRRYSQPQSTAGYATLGSLRITQKAEEIPLRKGIGFGFKWKARNLPKQAVITYLMEHPPVTRPDGRTLTRFEERTSRESRIGLIQSANCYFLTENHELVPGTWTLSILHRGTLLVKRSFRVKRVQ